MTQPKAHILPIIVISQFFCTSLWFASNGVMNDLVTTFGLPAGALGNLTSSVQFGFISGTLIFALLSIADRYSPSKVFFVCATLGAAINLGAIWEANTYGSLLALRFTTGFFLAGIYPVGMKIAADHFDKGLGKSLGFLVGALVLGTCFPHFLKGVLSGVSWRLVISLTSIIAFSGGLLMQLLVPDGPYRKAATKLDLSNFFRIFRKKPFRSAAFGYFGHMWELYAFWAFVPVILTTYLEIHPDTSYDISLLSFIIIGVGTPGCILGGYLSLKYGPKRPAFTALLISGLCCLISPFIFSWGFVPFFIFLVIWGVTVITDSPLFSTLVAQNADPQVKGTALTIVNSIGFLITIFSIQTLSAAKTSLSPEIIYLLLFPGPVLGLVGLGLKKS